MMKVTNQAQKSFWKLGSSYSVTEKNTLSKNTYLFPFDYTYINAANTTGSEQYSADQKIRKSHD